MKTNVLKWVGILAGLAGASLAQAQDAWIVGQSAPLTGSNAAFGKDIRDGALAWFKSVNARGGVGGKPIELVTLDDANDRKTAGANTQKLLTANGAVAVFGYASATLSLDAMPQADKAGVLFFAPFSGANPVRQAPPVVFTVRASYADELEKMLAFWTGVGAKQVVVVHYDDEVGKQNLAVVVDYLKKQGKTPAAFSIQRNAKLDANNIAQLMALKPDVIISTVLSGPAADISKQIAARGAFVPTSSLSFVGAQQYITAAGEAAAGVSITQVVPNPNSRLPVVAECAKAMQEAGMAQAMNSTHLEACIGAKVLAEAMRRAKKPGDARALLASMQSLGRYDLGGFTVNYGPGQNHGSKFVELAMVTRDGKLKN
jgi:branched-chain amino acid transport system substrate-binding protein